MQDQLLKNSEFQKPSDIKVTICTVEYNTRREKNHKNYSSNRIKVYCFVILIWKFDKN